MKRGIVCLAGPAVLILIPLIQAADEAASRRNWSQWRGPLTSGVAPEGNPPVTWSETDHLKWKFKIPGYGTSTPIVWDDQVFILTAVPTGKPGAKAPASGTQAVSPPAESASGGAPREARPDSRRGGRSGGGSRTEQPSEIHQWVVLAVDRQSGKVRWQKTAREELPHEGHHGDHGYASYSPVTDGELLFVPFGSRGFYAYDLKGNLKWETDLGDMQTRMGFGEGGSMALHDNTLVVNWDHEGEDFVVALDKRSGRELWRQPRSEVTTWSTPLIVEHNGQPQAIITAAERVRGYDLATGKQLWECGGLAHNVVPSPVAGFGMVYAICGHRASALLAIKLGHTGDLTDSNAIAWRHGRSTPYVPSPLLYGERLYFCSRNDAILSCFDARTGRALIDAERLTGISGVYASPAGAADRVYLVGRDGSSLVIKNADTVQVLATNRLEDRFDASPAIAGKELFLRGHQYLYCLTE